MNTNSVVASVAAVGVVPPTVAHQQIQSGGSGAAAQASAAAGQPTQTNASTGTVQTPGATTDGKGAKEPSQKQVAQAVASVNDHLNQLRSLQLEFGTDEKSGHMVIKLMDTSTNKMVRQIPPEYLLNLADSVGKTKGWLVEEKA